MDSYLMMMDNRVLYNQVNRMKYEINKKRTYMLMSLIIVVLIITLISMAFASIKTTGILMMLMSINMLKIIAMGNIDIWVAMQARCNYLASLLRIILSLLHPNIFRNVKKRARVLMLRALTIQMNGLEESMMLPRKETEKLLDQKEHLINDYWDQKGLSLSRLKDESTNVRFITSTPDREDSQVYDGYNITQSSAMPEFIMKEMGKWGFSDMSDEMHAKSLHKRICSKKQEYLVSEIRKFNKLLEDDVKHMTIKETNKIELVKKALSTKGTAGQFGKRSNLETMWKDSTMDEMVQVWMDLTKVLIDYVYIVNDLPEEIVAYMLYRKREILPYDEDGEIKITRLMNSPNLMARVTDSVVFGEMNESIVSSRENMIANVGMNIFVEMKMVLPENNDYIRYEWDISDFDGGQCGAQLIGNCRARVKFAKDHNQDIKYISYLIWRYYRHAKKIVHSTWGIQYEVIGQQASGDITTSDDNSCKSAAFVGLIVQNIISELNEIQGNVMALQLAHKMRVNKDNKTWYSTVHGDDGSLTIMKEIDEIINVEEIIERTGRSIGWKIKTEDFKKFPCKQDGTQTFLSHQIKTMELYSDEYTYTAGIVVRDMERLVNKWAMSAELDGGLTRINVAKLSGKYLSFLMTSLGHPDMMVVSAYALMVLRSGALTELRQYTWFGVRAETLKELFEESIIKMQIPLNGMNIKEVSASSEQLENIKETIGLMNNIVKNYNASRKIKTISFDDIIGNQRLHIGKLIAKVKSFMVELEKHSEIRNMAGTDRWWDITPSETKQKVEGVIGKITKCCSNCVFNNEITNDSKYAVKFYCSKCWGQRKEYKYSGIHIKVEPNNKQPSR